LGWIEANTVAGAGIRVTARDAPPYPEVTGYFIPTLLAWGEHERAFKYARWLVSIQQRDGSWLDPAGGAPYTFDTGQILKGLLAVLPDMTEVREPLRRGCDWLLTQVEPSGGVVTPDASQWKLPGGGLVPDSIHLYAIEPLRRAAQVFCRADYAEAVERALAHYLARPELTGFDTLSHFHAYVIEALIDLGCRDRAAEGMAAIERLQRRDGSVAAYRDANWICSTGLAQYALIWYRLGKTAPAERAFERVCRLQNPSGGFFGGYGRGANYFPNREISWAVKYFLDALTWHIRTSFDDTAHVFPTTIRPEDGRYRVVEDAVRSHPGAAIAVLDAGCGKGRFIRLLKERNPEILATGLDVSEAMLAHLPPEVAGVLGSLLNIPLPDASMDLVFCVEALEHAVNVPAAIHEMSRVLREHGTLVIVDKDEARRGVLEISAWEQWFVASEIEGLLIERGFRVTGHRNIPYEASDGQDGLFLGWLAKR
jgi:malonyl-CoA O-methyltransferase